MKPDFEFERKLQATRLKGLPAEWRGEILAAARSLAPTPATQPVKASVQVAGWWSGFIRIFDPYPRAWAGLAAVWLVIFGLSQAGSPGGQKPAAMAAQVTPEMLADLKPQQKLYAELLGSHPGTQAKPHLDPADRPHTWRREPAYL